MDKSKFIPAGNLEKEQEKDRKKILEDIKGFFDNPLIPWWTKAAAAVCPTVLHKPERTAKWCKDCGRKHSRKVACNLVKVKDLTTEPKPSDDPEKQRPTKHVGHYIQPITARAMR